MNPVIYLAVIIFSVWTASFACLSATSRAYAGQVGSYEELFTLQANVAARQSLDMVSTRNEGSKWIFLDPKSGLSGVAVNGRIELYGEHAFARIILVDSVASEHLIFETSPLLSETAVIVLDRACDETGYLDNITAGTLKIESRDASVRIDEVLFAVTPADIPGFPSRQELMSQRAAVKIAQINRSIARKGMHWIAGETSISSLSYGEKKALMGGRLPNLYGFEYYIGGLFEIPSESQSTSQTAFGDSPYVAQFSWRNRHAQDWVTPVKSQDNCGSCWAFAATGAVELLVNLYFNRHLDLDLSEQEVLSCSDGGSCNGGHPGDALDYFIYDGVMDEDCFSYTASDLACEDESKCTDPQEKIFIEGKTRFNRNSEDELKGLVLKGPVSLAISSWGHAIGLVGYKTIQEGDRIYIQNSGDERWVDIPEGDPLIGRTAWLIKNSWNTWWGDNGFAYVVTDLSNIISTYGVNGPVESMVYAEDDVLCADNDDDGYCWWGLGVRPGSCPPCAVEPDGDDADGDLGPMDEYGHLQILSDQIHRVQFVEGANGAINGDLVQDINHGEDCSPVTAVPDTGYHFTGWSGDYTGDQASLIIQNVRYDMTISAEFEEDEIETHTVRFIAGANGRISGDIVQEIAHGGNCTTVTAVPDTGYHFAGWSGDATGSDATLTIQNVTSDMTISASFEINTYTVSFNTGENGIISGNLVQTIAHGGNCTTVTAAPDTGYHFAGWSGDYTSNETTLTIQNVTSDMTLTAGFEINTYTVSFNEGDNGTISGDLEQTIAHGGNCTAVTAAPETGYHFTGWSGDYTGNQAALTLQNVTSDMTVNAGFEINIYTVSFNSGANGTISGDLEQTIAHGGDCTAVTAAPETGYHFTGWSGDYTGNEATLTLQNVTSDTTVSGGFEINTYTVRFIAGANGTIDGETEQKIQHGQACSPVTAVPDDGYVFAGWSGDYESIDSVLSLDNIVNDMDIQAQFENQTASEPPGESAAAGGGGGGCFIGGL
jgi:uncharacterized repeat protein (TIGR02543 family)